MIELENISHVYKGLMLRNRAFASFKEKDELDIILRDLAKYASQGEYIFDPMSGYGGGMRFFGKNGYKTVNVELNPPAYYWQVLNNPINTVAICDFIEKLLTKRNKLPDIKQELSISDNFFTEEAVIFIEKLYKYLLVLNNENEELTISVLLPFVSRFANYQRSSANITHFKEGGLCSYTNWQIDFIAYLEELSRRLLENFTLYRETEHHNILSDIMNVEFTDKFAYFVTSPPYPNYRDYSKLFRIENWVLDNVIYKKATNFERMIGSNNVSGKSYGEIYSLSANKFLSELLEKSKKLQKKSKRDIEVYYHPYFCQYFYNIQESYRKLDSMLSPKVMGYIVVNDNITRDISIPVGASICDIFSSLGYNTEDFNTSQISHYGNIGKAAKRINSHHTRHILKVWK